MFQVSIFKSSFTTKKNSHLYLCHIYIISTNTVIWSQINLEFHWFYLEITRKIHGILCHQRSGRNPVLSKQLIMDLLQNWHAFLVNIICYTQQTQRDIPTVVYYSYEFSVKLLNFLNIDKYLFSLLKVVNMQHVKWKKVCFALYSMTYIATNI